MATASGSLSRQPVLLVIFGAIVGWIASTLVGRSSKMGCGANVVVGILGSIIGGFVVRSFSPFPRAAVVGRFNLYSSRGRPGRDGAAHRHQVVQEAVSLCRSRGAAKVYLVRVAGDHNTKGAEVIKEVLRALGTLVGMVV